jgi:hypothetical protein
LRFFFDNCVSPHLAVAIRELAGGGAGATDYVALRGRFDEGIEDVNWITEIGREDGWIIISGDTRISRNPAERKAWIQSGLTIFFCGEPWNTCNGWKKAAALMEWWPVIELHARKTPKGYGYLMQPKSTKFRQIYPS